MVIEISDLFITKLCKILDKVRKEKIIKRHVKSTNQKGISYFEESLKWEGVKKCHKLNGLTSTL